jgi:hypothetical protein
MPASGLDEKVLSQKSVGLMKNLMRGRDSGLKYPDLSLHGCHYTPQNQTIFDSLSHLRATIALSPTDFWHLQTPSATFPARHE